jgi:trans-2,3-dihydro-3-hydroxyanthranilate isomerase
VRELEYVLLDVFTSEPFGGNQLAVFIDGEGLSSKVMQTIARELNLSETVFLFPPNNKRNHYMLRIFTPFMELPFAGHPTIGTAFLLGAKQMVSLGNEVTPIILEENIGLISVDLISEKGVVKSAEMTQPIPKVVEQGQSRDLVADLLSLSENELIDSLPIQSISAGIPFLFVPVVSLEAMTRINFRTDIWQNAFANTDNNQHIFAFCLEAEQPNVNVHCRMFAPAMGIAEDPATGSASGPLGYYLVQNNIGNLQGDTYSFVSEQGVEMGRPSRIEITIQMKEDSIYGVKVGGSAVLMGEGKLRVE